uniref:Uncharacterized protein n=1 Tax=Rhizophora mucronata TaxID=61149 RepID=A0A2P2NRZ4_RHIMU
MKFLTFCSSNILVLEAVVACSY